MRVESAQNLREVFEQILELANRHRIWSGQTFQYWPEQLGEIVRIAQHGLTLAEVEHESTESP